MVKRVAVVSALVEGNSVRATARVTDVSKPTILKLLADIGAACATFHDEHVRNLRPRRLQCDEIWQFVDAKAKNAKTVEQMEKGWGDIWTFTGIDADTNLIVSGSSAVAMESPRAGSCKTCNRGSPPAWQLGRPSHLPACGRGGLRHRHRRAQQ
jgi:hypothetical protein